MHVGKRETIDWDDLKSYNFNPKDKPLIYRLHGSCGTHALAYLTKSSPTKIDKSLPKNVMAWSDMRMVKYLREHDYIVQPVTINNVTNRDWPNDHISKYHVLLVGQHVLKNNEGTWSVCWNNIRYHSGYREELDPLEFINCPIDSAYIIYNKRWR